MVCIHKHKSLKLMQIDVIDCRYITNGWVLNVTAAHILKSNERS